MTQKVVSSGTNKLSLDDDYFDPELRRFVSVKDLWESNATKAAKCATDALGRIGNLQELATAIREGLSVAALKEHDTIRQIQFQSESLVQEVHRRESELTALVAETAAIQRDHLLAVLSRVEAVTLSLRANVEVLDSAPSSNTTAANEMSKAKFQALSELGELLSESAYFRINPPGQFVVSSRPIGMEGHLSLAIKKGVLHVPLALTVPTNRASMRVACDPSKKCPFGAAPGILHYIATLGGTRHFVNPLDEGAVAATSSAPFITGRLEDLFSDITATPPVECRTASVAGCDITIDLGDHRRVELHRYLLRHGHEDEHAALRSWRLEASNDNTEWTELDSQSDQTLGRSPFNEAFFTAKRLMTEGDAERFRFRFVRLRSTGANAAGEAMHHIEVSRIELYGTLFTV